MAPAGGRRVHPHVRAAHRVLQPSAVLRAGSAGRVSQVGDPADRRRSVTVVTYNVRAAIGPGPFPRAWWRHIRDDRLERIGAIIRELEPDIVSLQEVGLGTADGVVFDQATRLGRLTGMESRYGAAHHLGLTDAEDDRTVGAYLWGNAVLSRWPIVSSWLVALPTAAHDDLVEGPEVHDALAGVAYRDAPAGSRERRSLLVCHLDVGGAPVHVLATHLTHVGSEQRAGQARRVAGEVASLRDPVILAADLNAASDSADLAALAGAPADRSRLTDAFAAVGVPVGDTRRASWQTRPIDHILVRGLVPVSCRVVREAGDASDHWPVVATLRV